MARSRAHPPPFAARFAPTDAEVFHVFAGEAEWMASHYPDQASAQWGWLATAPRDRKGFLAELERHPYADIYAEMARKMYTAVDAYQRWLAQ